MMARDPGLGLASLSRGGIEMQARITTGNTAPQQPVLRRNRVKPVSLHESVCMYQSA